MPMQPGEWEHAHALVALVEERTASELVLLRKRIEAVMSYMDGVASPNMHTLSHVRRYLSGGYDNALKIGKENES